MEINEKLRGIFYIAGIIMFVCFALFAARGYIMIEKVEIETMTAISEAKQEAINSIDRMEANATRLMDNANNFVNNASGMLIRTEIKINEATDELSITMQSIQKTAGSMEKGAMEPISIVKADIIGLIGDAEETIQNIDRTVEDISETAGDMKIAAREIRDAAGKIENLLP